MTSFRIMLNQLLEVTMRKLQDATESHGEHVWGQNLKRGNVNILTHSHVGASTKVYGGVT